MFPSPFSVFSSASSPPFPLASSGASFPVVYRNTSTPPPLVFFYLISLLDSLPISIFLSLCFSVTLPWLFIVLDVVSSLSFSDSVTSLAGKHNSCLSLSISYYQFNCYVIFVTVLFFFCSHVYYMSGDAWKEGGIDATGKH